VMAKFGKMQKKTEKPEKKTRITKNKKKLKGAISRKVRGLGENKSTLPGFCATKNRFFT